VGIAFLAQAAAAQMKPPEVVLGTPQRPVRIAAPSATRWTYLGATVIRLQGPCRLRSGATVVSAEGAILWLNEQATGDETAVDVYAEGNVQVSRLRRAEAAQPHLYARLVTRIGVVFEMKAIPEVAPPVRLGLYARALQSRYPGRPLPWKPLTEEEKVFRAREFSFLAKTYVIEREKDQMRFVLHGDVRVETADATLLADNVVLWTEAPEQKAEGAAATPEAGRLTGFYAQGSVVFFGPEGSLRADEFYLDTLTEEGIGTHVILRSREEATGMPVTFAAAEAQQVDRYTLLARDGYFSTTPFVDPNYSIWARTFRVVHDRPSLAFTRPKETETIAPSGPFASAPPQSMIVSGRNTFFRIGPYKIFYWPFIARDFGPGTYLLRTFRFGSDSELGTFFKTAWNPYDLGLYRNDWSEVTLNLDWYSERGIGMGADVQYETPTGFGFVTTYRISDQGDTERDGSPLTETNRGRVLWRHREFLAYDWRLDLEFAYRSDRDFLPTFFREEFEEGKAQETLLYLRKIVENRAYTVLLTTRINDFDTYVERLPELAFRWFDQPFWNSRLLFSDQTTLSYLKLRFDDLGLSDPDATGRFDTSNEVALPLDLGRVWFEPYVGGDFTYFSSQADGSGGDTRFAGRYGFRSGTNFYRTYPAESAFFDIHGIRHILTPTLNYQHLYYVSDAPTKYTIYDDEIDGRDREHEVHFRLRSRWQTRRGVPGERRTVDFLTMDTDFFFYPGDRGHNAGRDDFLGFNAVWRYSDRLTLFSRDNKFNLTDGHLDVANFGFKYRLWKPLRFTYEHDWVRREGGADRSISTVKLSYSPQWSRWQLDLEQRYDFNGKASSTSDRDEQWLTNIIALSRDLNGWRLIINAEFNQGVSGGSGLTFQLQPTALTARRVEL